MLEMLNDISLDPEYLSDCCRNERIRQKKVGIFLYVMTINYIDIESLNQQSCITHW